MHCTGKGGSDHSKAQTKLHHNNISTLGLFFAFVSPLSLVCLFMQVAFCWMLVENLKLLRMRCRQKWSKSGGVWMWFHSAVLYTQSLLPVAHTPAVSQLLSHHNDSDVALHLPIWMYNPSSVINNRFESLRGVQQSLNSLQATTFPDRMSGRTKLPGNTDGSRKFTSAFSNRVWA